MSGDAIRPLERRDLDQVAGLYERVARSGSSQAPPGLGRYFEETLFNHPWYDPEIPSLVSEADDGTLVGFIGSHVRRISIGEQAGRLACCGQMVTDPAVRKRAVGAFLLRAYIGGPQDMTLTDSASGQFRRMWESVGGVTVHLQSIGWIRFFGPWGYASRSAGRRYRRVGRVVQSASSALDAVSRRIARSALRPPEPQTLSEELTPKALVAYVEAAAPNIVLRPAYDVAFVEWLFEALAAVPSRGRLVRRLVHGGGRTLGWYVYYLQPGGVSQVVQVGARERDAGDVLDHLFADAHAGGSVAVQGRLEAHLREPLSERRCFFRSTGNRSLVHSRDPELPNAIEHGRSLIGRLEGEWWMGHHLEPFDRLDEGARRSP
jgi:hypothetical protein